MFPFSNYPPSHIILTPGQSAVLPFSDFSSSLIILTQGSQLCYLSLTSHPVTLYWHQTNQWYYLSVTPNQVITLTPGHSVRLHFSNFSPSNIILTPSQSAILPFWASNETAANWIFKVSQLWWDIVTNIYELVQIIGSCVLIFLWRITWGVLIFQFLLQWANQYFKLSPSFIEPILQFHINLWINHPEDKSSSEPITNWETSHTESVTTWTIQPVNKSLSKATS